MKTHTTNGAARAAAIRGQVRSENLLLVGGGMVAGAFGVWPLLTLAVGGGALALLCLAAWLGSDKDDGE